MSAVRSHLSSGVHRHLLPGICQLSQRHLRLLLPPRLLPLCFLFLSSPCRPTFLCSVLFVNILYILLTEVLRGREGGKKSPSQTPTAGPSRRTKPSRANAAEFRICCCADTAPSLTPAHFRCCPIWRPVSVYLSLRHAASL